MVDFRTLIFASILVAAVTCFPATHKRAASSKYLIRTDLKRDPGSEQGQSPRFKNNYLGYSQVDSDGIIALPQTDKASAGSFILDSLNLELDINGNETYVNLGRQRDHPSAKQPVTLGGEGHSVGLYYTVDQELKADALGWETWMICSGDEDGEYPKLFWAAAIAQKENGRIEGKVFLEAGCNWVRLYLEPA